MYLGNSSRFNRNWMYEVGLLNKRTDAATSALRACRDKRTNGLISSFVLNWGKLFTEAYGMLKEVYGNECLSRTQVFEWFQRFKEGRETTEDDPRPGRPSTSKGTKTLKEM
ncbi:hypothetical protein NQ318_015023, partial [Aromia moschata]